MDSCSSPPPPSTHNPIVVDDEYADSSDDEYVLRTTGRPAPLNAPPVVPTPPSTLQLPAKVETSNVIHVQGGVLEQEASPMEAPRQQVPSQKPAEQGTTVIQDAPPQVDARPSNDQTHVEQPSTENQPMHVPDGDAQKQETASGATLAKEPTSVHKGLPVIGSGPRADPTLTLQSSEDQLMQDLDMEIQEQESSAVEPSSRGEPSSVEPRPNNDQAIALQSTEDPLMQDIEMEVHDQESSTRESGAQGEPLSVDSRPSNDQAQELQSTEDQLMKDIEMEIQEQELSVQGQPPAKEYLSKEERELRQLEWEIQVQESVERNKHLPSQVQQVMTADSPELPKPEEIITRCPLASKRHRLRNKCMVQEVEYDPIFSAKYKAPKTYSDGSILFTPAHFYTGVVGPVLQWLATHHPFAHLRASIRDHKGDKTSNAPYSVYCHGTRLALDAFTKRMTEWVYYRVTMANLQCLASDPENLMADVAIPSTSRVGGNVPNFDELNLPAKQKLKSTGVWFDAEPCNEGLPRIVGFRAFEAGCAITAVNWEPVNDQSALRAHLAAAAEHRAPIILSLCLSKYANTSRINRVEHRLRRLDGKKFEPAIYEKMRLDWVMNQVKRPNSRKNRSENSTPYLLYPLKPVPIPPNLPKEQPRDPADQKAFVQDIMSNKRSVEVDVFFDPEYYRGFDMTDFGGPGIWCRNISPHSQLAKIFGENAVRLGVVLAKANSVEPMSTETLAVVMGMALHCQNKMRLTFVLADGTDLSGLDTTCLLGGPRRVNPRRRNGQPYPLHLRPLPKAKAKPKAKPKRKRADTAIGPRTRTSSFDSVGNEGDAPLASLKKKRTKKNGGAGTMNGTSSSVSTIAKRQKVVGSATSTNEAKVPKGAKLAKKDTSADMVDKKKSYDSFIAKYKDTVAIEYEGYIQNQQAFSSMWRQHREVQGVAAFCDDSCTCVGKLPKLVKYVIGDFIESQNKKGVTVNQGEIRKVGFATWFTKRFLPQLKNEYPRESPRQLLDRLVAMWRIHVKHPTYGLTCRKECECSEEWNGIFMKGRNESDEIGDTSAVAVETVIPSIPKKAVSDPNLPTVSDPQSLPRKGMTTSVSNLLSRIVDKAEASSKPLALPPLTLFDLTFDTSRPLGIYFLDIIGRTDVCKVHSVEPLGQGRKLDDTNLVKGITVITASVQGGQVQHIHSSITLRDIYFEAKKKQRGMRISFQTMRAGFNSNQNDKDWNEFGAWIGRDFEGGWDGVSATVKPVLNKEANADVDKNPKTKPVTQPQLPQPIEPAQEDTAASSQAGWILRDSKVIPKHRSQAKPVSLLRKSRESEPAKERTKKRLVQFNGDLVRRRDYVTTSNANQVLECTSPDAFQAPQQTLYEQAADATKFRKCKDLIDALSSGSSSGQSLKDHELRYLYNLTKDLYTAADAKSQKDPSDVLVENQKEDLVAKRAVLSVQLSAAHYIEMAMSLKHWTKLEMKVCQIEMLRNRSSVQQQQQQQQAIGSVHGLAKLKLPGRPDQVVGEIPSMEFQEFLLLDEEGQGSYELSNNSAFKLERRQFALEFVEESSGSELCSFSEFLNVIDELCPQSTAEIHYQIKIREANDKISGGNLELKVRRKKPEVEFIQDKRAQAEKGLRDRIATIGCFNQDFAPEFGRLSGNVVAECGASLLHAAINLQNVAMVEELVALGADPFMRSEIGTPMGLAVKFREKIEEKLEHMKMESANSEKPSINPEAITRTEELLNLFKQIVSILKGSQGHTPIT
eukprot:Nitzschia sp. Nitz4//scaffold11_size288233//151696//157122//NITZ4_000776-RA/size288233-augustus-gene-0.278-mRNA-1//1//CDS//3329534080//9119//frame0